MVAGCGSTNPLRKRTYFFKTFTNPDKHQIIPFRDPKFPLNPPAVTGLTCTKFNHTKGDPTRGDYYSHLTAPRRIFFLYYVNIKFAIWKVSTEMRRDFYWIWWKGHVHLYTGESINLGAFRQTEINAVYSSLSVRSFVLLIYTHSLRSEAKSKKVASNMKFNLNFLPF